MIGKKNGILIQSDHVKWKDTSMSISVVDIVFIVCCAVGLGVFISMLYIICKMIDE